MKTQNILAFAAGAVAGYFIFGNQNNDAAMGASLPTLKEISSMYPGDYSVDDMNEKRGNIRSWDDDIIIYLNKLRKYKTVKRKSAYKYGLASRAHE